MTNDGMPTRSELEHLDVRQLHSAMKAVADFFEGPTDALDGAFGFRGEATSGLLDDLYDNGHERAVVKHDEERPGRDRLGASVLLR
jgi:hypothetical protein